MARGGCFTASLVLAQLLGSGHSVRRPAHTALAAFQSPSGQSYSVSRVTTWCPDENGNMHKVEKEVQKRGLFDGEKWRSGTSVTEWENGRKKTNWVEGDRELSKHSLPRTHLQRSVMADMFVDPDPLFEMEGILDDIFPRAGFFRRGRDYRIPSLGDVAVRTQGPSLWQRLHHGWDKVRVSASGLLSKFARGVGHGWRKLTGAVASMAESRKNGVCDTGAPSFQSESKTVEFRVADDGRMEGKETVSNFADGKWETVERPLEAEIVEGLRAERARRITARSRGAAPGMANVIDAEVVSKN